eukprot:3184483-Rhodomonas_salina.1
MELVCSSQKKLLSQCTHAHTQHPHTQIRARDSTRARMPVHAHASASPRTGVCEYMECGCAKYRWDKERERRTPLLTVRSDTSKVPPPRSKTCPLPKSGLDMCYLAHNVHTVSYTHLTLPTICSV